jgi:hypothetical protein
VLDWNDNSEEDLGGYQVYRSETAGVIPGARTLIAGNVSSSTYTDNSCSGGTTYYYRVTARDTWGNESDPSNEATAATPEDTVAPRIVSVEAIDATTVAITFSEPVQKEDAEKVSNYSIDNSITVLSAHYDEENSSAALTTATLSEGVKYTVTVSDIRDRKGNVLSDNRELYYFSGMRMVESFEGYPVGDIEGNGGGSGGWLGPWQGHSDVIDVTSHPLEANGVHGGATALRVNYGNGPCSREFSSEIGLSSDKAVWIRYLLRWDENDTYTDGNRFWLSTTSGNWDHGFVGVQTSAGGGDFIASEYYASNRTGGPEFRPGNTVMIVAEVSKNRMNLWVDPENESATPAISFAEGWSTFPGIRLTSRYNDDTVDKPYIVDGIVIGETFASVTSAYEGPETPTVMPEKLRETQAVEPRIRRAGNSIITVEGIERGTRIELFDISGKLLFRTGLRSSNSYLFIPSLSHSGITIVRLKSGKNRIVQKKITLYR